MLERSLSAAAVFMLSTSLGAQAANYEFHPNWGGYVCQTQSSKVSGGTMAAWKCNATSLLIDKDTGSIHLCSAFVGAQFLNGKYFNELSGSRKGRCQEIVSATGGGLC